MFRRYLFQRLLLMIALLGFSGCGSPSAPQVADGKDSAKTADACSADGSAPASPANTEKRAPVDKKTPQRTSKPDAKQTDPQPAKPSSPLPETKAATESSDFKLTAAGCEAFSEVIERRDTPEGPVYDRPFAAPAGKYFLSVWLYFSPRFDDAHSSFTIDPDMISLTASKPGQRRAEAKPLDELGKLEVVGQWKRRYEFTHEIDWTLKRPAGWVATDKKRRLCFNVIYLADIPKNDIRSAKLNYGEQSVNIYPPSHIERAHFDYRYLLSQSKSAAAQLRSGLSQAAQAGELRNPDGKLLVVVREVKIARSNDATDEAGPYRIDLRDINAAVDKRGVSKRPTLPLLGRLDDQGRFLPADDSAAFVLTGTASEKAPATIPLALVFRVPAEVWRYDLFYRGLHIDSGFPSIGLPAGKM